MNFLAHIFLSGDDEQIKIGNFIGDYVKGSAFHIYPDKIKEGILLHRFIDTFTDKNKYTLEAKALFTPKYRKYSGIVMDILYDHFLAVNWNRYSKTELLQFINHFHDLLEKYNDMLPAEVQEFIPRLIANQRIYSYRKKEGIKSVLKTMATYTSLPDYSDFAIETLEKNYSYLEENFILFFSDIKYYVKTVHGIEFLDVAS